MLRPRPDPSETVALAVVVNQPEPLPMSAWRPEELTCMSNVSLPPLRVLNRAGPPALAAPLLASVPFSQSETV